MCTLEPLPGAIGLHDNCLVHVSDGFKCAILKLVPDKNTIVQCYGFSLVSMQLKFLLH